ncbi:T9SS type A sorting domain-containing protein [Kordia jejudonensis]|uniref:T9SS type A sorting domain-containing protein n=1 Tax=Kordia jejudonensis TaxID=1348245 RepID=UPI000629C190|nr:T9SS type A sorting domain-containing protein [Kordia jejudonensis]
MNLKSYTLTALCLFFMLKINAQATDYSPDVMNKIDLTLLVEDSVSGQKFSLLADDFHYVQILHFVNYNVRLNYQSQEDTTHYFRIRCIFEDVTLSSPSHTTSLVDPLMLGATAPVIIPPVKKKKKRQVVDSEPIYPYLAKIIYRMYPKRYRVTIELLQYETEQDYLDNTGTTEVKATKVIFLDTLRHSSDRSSIVAYPNPTVDYLYIRQTDLAAVNEPLQIVIYSDKGAKMSQHTLTNKSTTPTEALYDVNTSHLPNGTYYVHLTHGGKTEVKTIIKK